MILVMGKGRTGEEVVKLIPKDQLLDVCTTKNPATLGLIQKASCIIVFVPTDAFDDVKPLLIESGKPVVVGTTNIDLSFSTLLKAPWIVGSNFSIGMNLMFSFARDFPRSLIQSVEIFEEHHVHKKDSPSGTALYLKSLFPDFTIDIEAKRAHETKGIHTLTLKMNGETLSMTHQSSNREIYAKGALLAAQNIHRYEPGLYHFEEIIKDLYTWLD